MKKALFCAMLLSTQGFASEYTSRDDRIQEIVAEAQAEDAAYWEASVARQIEADTELKEVFQEMLQDDGSDKEYTKELVKKGWAKLMASAEAKAVQGKSDIEMATKRIDQSTELTQLYIEKYSEKVGDIYKERAPEVAAYLGKIKESIKGILAKGKADVIETATPMDKWARRNMPARWYAEIISLRLELGYERAVDLELDKEVYVDAVVTTAVGMYERLSGGEEMIGEKKYAADKERVAAIIAKRAGHYYDYFSK